MLNYFYNLDIYNAIMVIYIAAIAGTALMVAAARIIKNIIHNVIK